FVEELLASPGIPETISDTVRGRLAEFPDHERAVLEAAAVMGRQFDWEILPAASGQPAEVVSRALARAAGRVLVTADGAGFQFRHTLTREAVLMAAFPPRLRGRRRMRSRPSTPPIQACRAGGGTWPPTWLPA